jgi:2-oxoisovalerate dehydrogenase E1 component
MGQAGMATKKTNKEKKSSVKSRDTRTLSSRRTSVRMKNGSKGSAAPEHKSIALYKKLLLPRLIEEKMLILLRQGRVSKWFSGIGQEAIAVGCTAALHPDEFILPLHRNLGVFTTRGVPLWKLIAQWQGKSTGFTKGRDRSFHFGTKEYSIVGMISHLGPQLCVADGIALASKLKKEGKVTLVFSGEGGTSEGDFHEALNVAAVWHLPVIFVVENNGYALSTPTSEQFKCAKIADRAKGYGIEGVVIDGNNVEEVYSSIDTLAKSIRKKPRPVLVECMTFRMRGHEEASGIKYVPKKLISEWEKKDPIASFERKLVRQKLLSKAKIAEIKSELMQYIDASVEHAFSEPECDPSIELEMTDLFSPCDSPPAEAPTEMKTMRFVDAISDGLQVAMRKNPELILMGQDIAEYGGVFKVTEGFVKEFGRERVRNTPLCESAIVGAALGLAVKGIPSVLEMQFADFVSCGFNQIVNNLAKTHYRWGQPVNVTVRMPTGAGTGAGPFHSQSNEAWFTHTPGLKVVYPSNPADAKGLLLASIEDPNPVLFFEHKALYRSVSGEVPGGYQPLELGKASVVKHGEKAVIITYGAGVSWAMKASEEIESGIVAVLDLRTLSPIDWMTISNVVASTGRVLILHEDTLFGGIGGEIAAFIGENLFSYLDAPVMRVASLDTPVPFAAPLERQFLPWVRLHRALTQLLQY